MQAQGTEKGQYGGTQLLHHSTVKSRRGPRGACGLQSQECSLLCTGLLAKFRKSHFPAGSVAEPGACSSLCLILGDPRAACSPTPGGLHATWSHGCPLCLLLPAAGSWGCKHQRCPVVVPCTVWRFRVLLTALGGRGGAAAPIFPPGDPPAAAQ